VALVTTNILEEHIASIFRIRRLLNPHGEDMPYDTWRREPLATAPPQLSLSVTVELLLMIAISLNVNKTQFM
jgi:hypothetical protein